MTDRPVRFEGVTKRFPRGERRDSVRDTLAALLRRRDGATGTFLALDDVSFHAGRGEALGIVGPNGSGKSTALKLLTGIYPPTSGTVEVDGRIAPLIEVGAGFHPDLTGRENIFLNGAISGMSRSEIRALFDRIVDFSGLHEFLDTPVKRYSSGMYMRLGFSIASHTPSDVLIVDEVLAVGDVGFRARCIDRMKELKREGRTILFVSHSAYQVRALCDRVVYLLSGKKVFDGDPVEGTRRYQADVLEGRAGKAKGPERALGDCPAAVREAQLLCDRSDEGAVLAPGDPLAVRVVLRIARDLPRPPLLSVSVLRGDGVVACVLNSRDVGFVLPTSAGDHTFVARFESLPIHPAKCSVEVLVWDPDMLVVLDQSTAGGIEFRVEGQPGINRPGVFVPKGSFRAEGA